MLNPGIHWDFILAFTVVLISLPVLIHLAPVLGLVDQPDERKHHAGSVPLVGGIAIYLALFLVLAIRHFDQAGIMELLAGSLLLLAIGVIDDRGHINPRYRFLVQTLAACLMIFGAEILLRDFGQLIGDWIFELKWAAIPVTVFCIVGVTNAANMIDGIDGLSATLFLVGLVSLALAVNDTSGGLQSAPEILVLAGALVAYLLFNLKLPWRKSALTFFGDAGTLVMGFLMAWLLIHHSQGPDRAIAPVTALWLFAVPLIDTVFLMIKRKMEGKSMVEADRCHLHHAFLQSGWSVNATLAVIVFIAAELAGIGLLFEWSNVPEYMSFYAFLLVAGLYYFGMNRFWKTVE